MTLGHLGPDPLESVVETWRVGSNCVDVDAVTWRAGMLQRIGYDWSAQPSGHTLADVRPAALDIARRYAQEARAGSGDLVRSDDEDFLIRLHLLGEDRRLTNAGSLLFVGTPHVGIDYMRRDAPGGDSTERIEGTGPLVEQVREAEQAGRAANRVTHLILDWVRARGRVSTTEAADLAGVSVGYAGTLLKTLAAAGSVAPGRPNAAGRGFFYVPGD